MADPILPDTWRKPCDSCPLRGSHLAGFFVPSIQETINPKWMLIGEAPGYDEAHANPKQPFLGRAGQVLRKSMSGVIASLGLRLPGSALPYITNAVKCWPGQGNETPTVEAINACREAYLDDEIKNFKGRKAVLLGATAAHAVNHKKLKMQTMIGEPVKYLDHLCMTTWHPAYFLYNHSKQILVDIERAIRWAIR